MRVYLGIDAGGSTCRARLADADGRILGNGVAGPATLRLGAPRAFAAMADAFAQAMRDAGLRPAEAANIQAALGVAGIRRRGALDALMAQPFPFQVAAVTNDAVIANIGAHSGRDGATVIIGTGSIGIARVRGVDSTVGGYGFPVSDEGSGADLGLSAIRASLRAMDGRGPETSLTRAVLGRFRGDPVDVIQWMDGATATDYAALAPLVVGHAAEGDPLAMDLLRDAARHVEGLVRSLLDWGAPGFTLAGGLSGVVGRLLPADLATFAKRPDGDALDGAVILAREASARAA